MPWWASAVGGSTEYRSGPAAVSLCSIWELPARHWATIISQFASFCLLLVGCGRGGNIRIDFAHLRMKPYYYLWIFKGGLPSLARQGLASVATICLNQAARPFGDAAIAAMGVVQRIAMFGGSAHDRLWTRLPAGVRL